VINSNLHHILHHFRYIAVDISKIVIFATPLAFNPPPTEGFPWDDLRKILPGDQRMAKILNGIEFKEQVANVHSLLFY